MLESPTLWQRNEGYYLFYNATRTMLGTTMLAANGGPPFDNALSLNESAGEKHRFGPAPGGPWGEAFPLFPGWAHEIWSGMDGQTYTSYLTDYTVTIQSLIWNTRYDPPRPFIGEQIVETFVPLLVR